jgi:hypothetical protein
MAAMMQMIQVFLREVQKAALKSIAARTGQKQSDLIRKSVDLLIDKARQDDLDWRAATHSVAGMWRHRTDLEPMSEAFRAAVKQRFSSIHKRG